MQVWRETLGTLPGHSNDVTYSVKRQEQYGNGNHVKIVNTRTHTYTLK